MRRLTVLVMATLAALVAAAPASALRLHDARGLHMLSVDRLNARLYAITFRTAALPEPVNVDILLPPRYGSHPHRRYPVFYLLHGTSGGASDWTTAGRAQSVIGNRDVITVMPDIALNRDGGGWCSDWPDGAQRWETFHIRELLPWVDANLRTLTARGERAIAGLSQGGFCSMSYAARYPDLFGVALAYSGAPDIYYDPIERAGAKAIINATEVALDHVAPDTFFGDPISNGLNWAAHDPATLAPNLRRTRLYLYWGNGLPGPYDNPATVGGGGIEALVLADNLAFEARLHSLHIPALLDGYGPGTHTWPYWTRDLQWSIGPIMADFAHPPAPPGAFTYTSADDRYSVYGWTVTMHRRAREFSTLERASGHGFALAGSGTGVVLTAALYRPGAQYRVRLSGRRTGTHTVVLRARRDRRLRIRVPLGPSNPFQQDTAQAQAAGTAVYTTTVGIRPAGR